MRISSQPVESPMKTQVSASTQAPITNTVTTEIKKENVKEAINVKTDNKMTPQGEERNKEITIVKEAVNTLNEFLQINNYSSKFVLHEGLDKYFVELIDPQTEEVIKEIPSKVLLDSFYEMQKLAGVIVDEKV